MKNKKFNQIIQFKKNDLFEVSSKNKKILIEIKEIIIETIDPSPIDECQKTEFGINVTMNIKENNSEKKLTISKFTENEIEAKVKLEGYEIELISENKIKINLQE